jgi:hypothetical protein
MRQRLEEHLKGLDRLPSGHNRRHFQKALLLALIGVDELPAGPDLQPIAEARLARGEVVQVSSRDLHGASIISLLGQRE